MTIQFTIYREPTLWLRITRVVGLGWLARLIPPTPEEMQLDIEVRYYPGRPETRTDYGWEPPEAPEIEMLRALDRDGEEFDVVLLEPHYYDLLEIAQHREDDRRWDRAEAIREGLEERSK